MIKPGPNILRFINLKSKRHLIYDVLRFRAQECKKDPHEIEFQYQVPIGNSGGELIRELRHLVATKEYVLVDLIEQNRMLCIKMIKELPEPQEFYETSHNNKNH
jgi:hypothetical protein